MSNLGLLLLLGYYRSDVEGVSVGGRVVSKSTATAFYDTVGSALDLLCVFEDEPRRRAVEKVHIENSRVLEFGCGTGRVAERLIVDKCASYLGLDASTTMTNLARKALSAYPSASVQNADVTSVDIPNTDAYDIVCAFYVIDLLSYEDSRKLFEMAHNCLVDHGRICLVSITDKPPDSGNAILSRVLMSAWAVGNRIIPAALGGCRPISLTDILFPSSSPRQTEEEETTKKDALVLSTEFQSEEERWKLLHNEVLSIAGYTSEIVIAEAKKFI